MKDIRFSRQVNPDFIKELKARVNEYFISNNISKKANAEMVFKTIFMIGIYVIPYILMMMGVVTNPWLVFTMWMLMGVGMAGIGLSIMHDANHGAYSKNENVNKFMGSLIYLVGGNLLNWKIQHNVFHHSFTNVEGADDDINAGKILRFSPHKERLKMHKFQHVYAWFFYGLMTMNWMSAKDFIQYFRYKKLGVFEKRPNRKLIFTELVFWKVFYYIFLLVLPLVFMPVPAWLIIVSFFSMHFIAGLILSCIFQLAHVMPSSEYPLPDDKGNIENNWAIHQLQTTCNFSPASRIMSWYVGGLNYQIEHHLFPNICHVHYRKLAKIVKETAKEYGLEYYSQKNFLIALKYHAKMLKTLGREDDHQAIAA